MKYELYVKITWMYECITAIDTRIFLSDIYLCVVKNLASKERSGPYPCFWRYPLYLWNFLKTRMLCYPHGPFSHT